MSLLTAPPPNRAAIARVALPVCLALLGALIVLNLISFGFGEAPLDTLARAFEGTWGTSYGIGQVLFKATPIIFTALAFEVAFRAGLFNIGAEGQLSTGSLVGALVAAYLGASLPGPLVIVFSLAAAMLAGAGVALVPALMRARLGVHEIISTIMLNRIVDVILPFVIVVVLGAKNLRTEDVPSEALMPRFDGLIESMSGSAFSAAFVFAVLSALVLGRWLSRSRAGREMRFVGLGPAAAQAEGVSVSKRVVQAMLISGGVAGLGMSATVLGYKGYYELGLGAGAGFTGIAVALLGRGHPVGMVLAAILFGTLQQAGLVINATVPREAIGVLEAVVIVMVAVSNQFQMRTRTAT